MSPKIIALTCGEPSGIGSEITLKAWEELKQELVFFWIGDPSHLPEGSNYKLISVPKDAIKIMPNALPVLPFNFPFPTRFGAPDLRNAKAVVDVLLKAVKIMREGQASAICTLPIVKQVLQDGASFKYSGHTDFLAAISSAKCPVMMLISPELKVVPATIHIPLSQVADSLKSSNLQDIVEITNSALKKHFKISNPTIAIAGLNPHAGERGKLGDEETTKILPVIRKLKEQGLSITGPHAADSMFHESARNYYDAAITMYHDQALIPIKTINFEKAVNLTLGLAFVRTSPDHGTALDIAGKAKANPSSLIEAIRLAESLGKTNGHD